MSRIGTKICGLSTVETLGAAVRGGAAYVGFVFFPKSPRHLEYDQVETLQRIVPDHVGRVGVFVDPEDEQVARAVTAGRLSAVQLHGGESPARAAELGRMFGIEIWKAVPVRNRADLARARSYKGAAQRIVYDAKTPEGAALPGGMGLRFDWRLLEGFDHPLPWALSGGLDPANIADAVHISGTRLLDVSSGVESAPGVKDVDKIARFLQSVERL